MRYYYFVSYKTNVGGFGRIEIRLKHRISKIEHIAEAEQIIKTQLLEEDVIPFVEGVFINNFILLRVEE